MLLIITYGIIAGVTFALGLLICYCTSARIHARSYVKVSVLSVFWPISICYLIFL